MLADGRWLCLECMEHAFMGTDECHELHVEIRDFFEGLFFKVEKEFPLLLVEKQALNKAEEEEKIVSIKHTHPSLCNSPSLCLIYFNTNRTIIVQS